MEAKKKRFVVNYGILLAPLKGFVSKTLIHGWIPLEGLRIYDLNESIVFHSVDGSEILHQLIGRLSRYSRWVSLMFLYVPGGYIAGFLPSTVACTLTLCSLFVVLKYLLQRYLDFC